MIFRVVGDVAASVCNNVAVGMGTFMLFSVVNIVRRSAVTPRLLLTPPGVAALTP